VGWADSAIKELESTLLHLVSAVDGDRVQISNNKGRVNGWVNKAAIHGVAEG
jgi:hypothetical protein